MGTIFVRFEKYLFMVCLKMAHLGRVAYCFGTLLILCKLVFFNYKFHKNIRRQKRFVSKQGQPRPHTQLKARLLTKQLKNGLFLRLHYSVHYYLLAFLPIVIVLTLFVKYVFHSQICALPLQPYLYSSGSCLISYIASKQTKQINITKFVNSGFRSVVVITSVSHAEGRQFKSGRKHCTFFLYMRQISTKY